MTKPPAKFHLDPNRIVGGVAMTLAVGAAWWWLGVLDALLLGAAWLAGYIEGTTRRTG